MTEPFVARLTPAEVVRKDAATGRRSTVMQGCLVERDGVEPVLRTVMAFGAVNAMVTRRLLTGRPVTLLCRFDGGSVRILGWPPRQDATS